MRVLLSPTSRANCENLSPSFPSHKLLYSPTLEDSCSSLNYSCVMQSRTKNSKFYSFKKIKEDRIKQKNQQGRIIKQMIYKDNKPDRKIEKLKTLDDAKTIESQNSPRSSVSVGKRIIEQSIILMRGGDLEKLVKQSPEDILDPDQPQTPCFKRRNTFTQQIKIRSDFLKPISTNPSLLRSIQSGGIFHYEIVKKPTSNYSRIMTINYEGVLQIYSTIELKSCSTHLSMVIYEPYTETLIEKLLKIDLVSYKQLITYMIEIVKVLSYLKNFCVFPEIEPTTVLLSNQSIKIKLRFDSQMQQTERQSLRECGYYFSSLIKNINGCCSTPSSSKRNKKITGLSIRKRLQFDNLMQEFIRSEDFTLDEAYLKLQAIDI